MVDVAREALSEKKNFGTNFHDDKKFGTKMTIPKTYLS